MTNDYDSLEADLTLRKAEIHELRSRLAEVTALAASRWDEQASLRKQLADSLQAEECAGLQRDKAERALAEAEACIKQIAHDDLEFGPLKMSARARRLMDAFLAREKS